MLSTISSRKFSSALSGNRRLQAPTYRVDTWEVYPRSSSNIPELGRWNLHFVQGFPRQPCLIRERCQSTMNPRWSHWIPFCSHEKSSYSTMKSTPISSNLPFPGQLWRLWRKRRARTWAKTGPDLAGTWRNMEPTRSWLNVPAIDSTVQQTFQDLKLRKIGGGPKIGVPLNHPL